MNPHDGMFNDRNRFDEIIEELHISQEGHRLTSHDALAIERRLDALISDDPTLALEFHSGTIEPDHGRYGRAAANVVDFTRTVAHISLPLIKKASVASAKAFQTTVTEMRRVLDRNGSYDLNQTEQVLSKAQGDGHGTFTDKTLAHALEINGEIPADYAAVLSEALKVSEAIVNNVVAQSNNAMAKIHKVIDIPADNMNFSSLERLLEQVAKILVDEPRLTAILDTHATKFTWPGGLAMAGPAAPRKVRMKGTSTGAAAGDELLARLREGGQDITVKPRPKKDVNLVGMDVLNRQSAEAVLDAAVHLINFNEKLLELAKGSDRSKFDPDLNVGSFDAIVGGLLDAALTNERKGNPKVAMSEQAEALDTVVVAYLKHYQYLNGRKVITGLFNRNLAAVRAGLAYVRASVKHYN